ncbi:hypothetical protein [Rhizorhabdus argentea]|uniref:hypothetical protein n=1 Tax=Rhizorhabdus argentea TaxID=1387174 RepID=UPI0030ED8461
MQLSSSFCRTQQAFHQQRADLSALENVKQVAGKAAIAWGLEAQVAESREARRERARLAAETSGGIDPFDDEDSPIFRDDPDA